MARLINPVLFSQHFGVVQADFSKAGLLDPVLNSDTKLFIDPLLLSSSSNKLIARDAFALLKERFGEIVNLVAASKTPGDKAWRTAAERMNLNERSETGLGLWRRKHKRQLTPGCLEAEDTDNSQGNY